MTSDREYRSTLATHMVGLVEAKRACGFDYSSGAYTLARLDRFCLDTGFSGAVVTPELSDSWSEAIPSEGGASHATRMGVLRQLSLYELSIGLDAYVPRGFSSREKPVPYLPTNRETSALFEAIDAYEDAERPYLAAGYRVAFRLMRLCGLRLAECANLAAADVDASDGALMIRHSKGAKDRVVYMADDVASMVAGHLAGLRRALGFAPEWVFPGKDPSKHIYKTSLDRKFSQFWAQVPGSEALNARPTPHSLRHAFVVERMNAWMSEGVSLPQMMPYLAAYLGHVGSNETFYYYHQVEEAFSIVRERDAVSARVIPEAVAYEEG